VVPSHETGNLEEEEKNNNSSNNNRTFAWGLHSTVTTPTAVPFAPHNLTTIISNSSDAAVIITMHFGPKGITPAFSLSSLQLFV
jgi:hypothetical protein